MWTEDSQNDWSRSSEKVKSGSYAARFRGSGTDSQLISVPINLQGKTSATITFYWYINSGLDSGEYIAFDISTDNGLTWTEKLRLKGNVDKENSWLSTNTILTELNDNLKVRFRGRSNQSSEKGFVDLVKVVAQ